MTKQKFAESYQKDFLDVGDGHTLYYELYGNPKGKPVLFLHGGPGLGFGESDKRFFNPDVWNVILFHQRGSGKSTPAGSIENNKTQNLVSDINKLLHHLDIQKVLLFGGSWGSTLALIYAIQHPEKVTGMMLRGIFLCNARDDEFAYGNSVRYHFPELWERFMSIVPETSRKDPISYYLFQMSYGDKKTKEKFAYEWIFYESFLSKMKTSEKEVEKEMVGFDILGGALIETHYLKNKAFLPLNYIVDNAYKIPKVPVSIVHGTYDFVCPAINAYDLHKKIPNSKLQFVFGGHSSSEVEVEKALIAEMKQFETDSSLQF